MNLWARNLKQNGFTIVELLVVIVVISILASVTVVAFNGIRERADDAVARSDLVNNRKKLLEHQAVNGSFPTLAQTKNKDQTNCIQGTAPGEVSTSGYYCPITSSGTSVNYYDTNISRIAGDSQTFSLSMGRGTKGYTITENGDITVHHNCISHSNASNPQTGYTTIYTCDGAGVTYSQ